MGSTFLARSKTRRIYQYSHSCKIFNFLRQAHANTRLNDLVSHKHLLKFHKDMQVKGHVCLETARAKRMCWYSWFRTSFMLGLSHTSTSPEPQSFRENRKVIHQCRAASRGTSENAEGTSCQGALGSGSRSCLRSTVNTSAVCETRMPERARPALWREAGELGRYGGTRDGKEAEALEASKFYKDKKK